MHIFVGRSRELGWFRDVMRMQHTYPFLLYGPLGCGKTTLAQRVAERAEELFGGDVVVLYINARAKRAKNALFTNAVQWLKEALSIFAKAVAGEVGEFLARTAVDIALYFAEKTSKDILLIVDEFHRAYREDPVGWVKYFMDLMEHPTMRDEGLRDKIYNVVLITSEYTAVERILPKGYADPYMVWNLAREEFRELHEALSPPIDFEALWRTCGGNPRCAGDLMELGWDVERYIKAIVKRERVDKMAREAAKLGAVELLRRATEDPDVLDQPGAERLERLLYKYNKVLELTETIAGGKPPRDPVIGIGERYAWHWPALRDAVAKTL
ncbi:ATP-binding protein [Thermoproteus tenax]|uniref:AAA+ superfamily ATPase n=1 Tax=Thermoproteus tenax (strain ATCC 35583 / DSM 2078 / JCM 9277 / NBRC 100435 / Kra 1) TaxID=768679 RepID=G4RK71_THETK|nr:ATP-binding protein [Thermoproteus tenax]CCC81966.1 AAA+ superfamily ATPase [Thermoproteus tenax Kra 1]